MKIYLKLYIASLILMLIAQYAAAQRWYTPLPLGESVYDTKLKIPLAVQYYLPAWSIGTADRSAGWPFISDIPDSVCHVSSSFYKNSGYDRGHMMAAADRSFDAGIMKATFVLSNVAPQTPALNRGQWKKAEIEARNLAIEKGELKIYNAPIFFLKDTTFISQWKVAVPHAFLKVAMSVSCDTIYKSWLFLNK